MTLPNLFSRRRRQAAGVPDVYQYATISPKLRQQTMQIIADVDAQMADIYSSNSSYPEIVGMMRKELGVPRLYDHFDVKTELYQWFLNHPNTDDLLDSIEVSFGLISYYANQAGKSHLVDNAISEFNARSLEDCFGFQLENGGFVQVNSTFTHSAIIVPALHILSDTAYATANAEFLQAHAEYRAGEYEDCIHDCANSLESVLKIILTKKGWSFKETDPASKLIAAVFDNDLIPAYMQNEFSGLRTILESGTPTVRNKNGGHGAGPNPRNIPAHIAAFQLHQTASAILLLAEAAK